MPTCPDGLPHHASAGGAAVVGDGKSIITYERMGSKISHLAPHETCHIYMSITNPDSKTAKLKRIQVECEGGNGGKIMGTWIYFGHHHVLEVHVPNVDSDYEIVPSIGHQIPNSQPFGTNVTFVLHLPNHDSFIKIISVALGFGHDHESDPSLEVSETKVLISE